MVSKLPEIKSCREIARTWLFQVEELELCSRPDFTEARAIAALFLVRDKQQAGWRSDTGHQKPVSRFLLPQASADLLHSDVV